jgi:hypothetical protein
VVYVDAFGQLVFTCLQLSLDPPAQAPAAESGNGKLAAQSASGKRTIPAYGMFKPRGSPQSPKTDDPASCSPTSCSSEAPMGPPTKVSKAGAAGDPKATLLAAENNSEMLDAPTTVRSHCLETFYSVIPGSKRPKRAAKIDAIAHDSKGDNSDKGDESSALKQVNETRRSLRTRTTKVPCTGVLNRFPRPCLFARQSH